MDSSMGCWALLVALSAVLASVALIQLLPRGGTLRGAQTAGSRPVPVVPGLPLLGNVVGLARHGVAYIHACRDAFGDVFELRLVGQPFVYVFDTALFEVFFGAPEDQIAFRPVAEQFTERVFGVPQAQFRLGHKGMLDTLRSTLAPGELAHKLEFMAQRIDAWTQQHWHGET